MSHCDYDIGGKKDTPTVLKAMYVVKNDTNTAVRIIRNL
jgi:hypothetical protein